MGALEPSKTQFFDPVMKWPNAQKCSQGPSVSSLNVKWRKEDRMDDMHWRIIKDGSFSEISH